MSRSGLKPGLAEALLAEIGGSFVQGVSAGDDLLVIDLRAPGRSRHLLLSIAGGLATGAGVLDEAPVRAGRASGGLLSFRDHARGAITGLKLASARTIRGGEKLVLEWEGAAGRASLVLDAGRSPNLALCRDGEIHALRRPHAREGLPSDWLAEDADPPATEACDLAQVTSALLVDRERLLAGARLRGAARALRASLAAARRLVSRRGDDVGRLGDASHLRAAADALAAKLHEVRQGQASVTVPRLDGEGSLELNLDPRVAPGENLRRAYAQAAKAERGASEARRQLGLARDRLARIEECALGAADRLAAIGDGEPSLEDAREIAQFLKECAEFLPRPAEEKAPAAQRKIRDALPEGVREFVSKDGLRILAGRSATSNDALTFRIARGNDAWLHARDVPGPHVVLVVPKRAEIPQESLLDAATVAHVLGKNGAEPKGEVIWARAKDVRRAKGAGPGKVMVSRERVLSLRVDPERVARLRLRAP